MSKTDGKELKEKLVDSKNNGWEHLSDEELENIFKFADEYMYYLNTSKTEKEIVQNSKEILIKNGFIDISEKENLQVGDKIFYINNSLFEELKKQTKTKAYILDIKNWANNENVVKKLSKNIDNDITIHINKESNINYENIIIFFNSFIILNIFLFLIVLIITIFNILEDEKKNHLMYRNIGFSQKQIIKTNILKVIFLLLIVFIFNSIIIYIILKNINI